MGRSMAFEKRMAREVLAALDADDDYHLMLAQTPYDVGGQSHGITIASARVCDDNITYVRTRYYAGLGVDNLFGLQVAYEGFEEPPPGWSRHNFDRRH